MLAKKHHFTLLCIGLAVVLGLLFRVPYYVLNDFALGDGGMFAAVIDTIRAEGYVYPAFTGYNYQSIPFAYPPFMFYVAALLTDVLGISTVTTLTYLPLAVNLLSIGAFVLLATRLLENRATVLLAAVVFPLLPWSYEAMIMAGGLTRGAGFLFMLLTLYAATHLPRTSFSLHSKPFFATLAFLALAALSHPETGIATAFALTLLILCRVRCWKQAKIGIVQLAALGGASAVLTAPWWGTVLARHGVSPFMAAGNSSMWSLSNFVGLITTLGIFDVAKANLTAAVIAGGFTCIAKKKWFLPVWFVLMFLATPRKAPTLSSVPYALLSAVGIHAVASYLIEWLAASKVSSGWVNKTTTWLNERSSLLPNYAAVLTILCLGYVAAGQLNRSASTQLWSLEDKEKTAMQWIKKNTSPQAEFVVLTPFAQAWYNDYQAEWFPYLTKRKSVTTAQGLEWMPDGAFDSKIDEIESLTSAKYRGRTLHTVESIYESFDYVAFFTPLDRFASEYKSRYERFTTSDRYQLVYSNGACLVFEKNEPENLAQMSSQ